MHTKIIRIKGDESEREFSAKIMQAAKCIRSNGLVVFPTETVYGLGCSALSGRAALKVFRAKNRPADNPLIVHIADISDVEKIAYANARALSAMEKLWPGPVTFLLRKKRAIPKEVTAGSGKVAVRMPSNKIALALITASRVPIAAPSANLSTKPSPTAASHAAEDLMGRVNIIIDGGNAELGIESTIIDMTGRAPKVLRLGSFSVERLKKHFPNIMIAKKSRTNVPGMRYRHYAPRTMLVSAGREDIARVASMLSRSKKVCILCSDETSRNAGIANMEKIILGSRKRPGEIAKHLFASLRELDRRNADIGVIERFGRRGIGRAIMNRIEKATQGSPVNVLTATYLKDGIKNTSPKIK
jgi:L-threonylcarbamoyladenylate synthase